MFKFLLLIYKYTGILFYLLLLNICHNIRYLMEERIENERLDRMEQHLSLMKAKNQEISEDVSKIKSALIGDAFTNGRGFVHTMEDVKKRMDSTEDDIAILKENMNILKWIARSTGALIFALILYIITK